MSFTFCGFGCGEISIYLNYMKFILYHEIIMNVIGAGAPAPETICQTASSASSIDSHSSIFCLPCTAFGTGVHHQQLPTTIAASTASLSRRPCQAGRRVLPTSSIASFVQRSEDDKFGPTSSTIHLRQPKRWQESHNLLNWNTRG